MTRLELPEKWLTQQISIDLVGAGGTGSQVIDQLASLDSLMRALGHPGFRVRVYDGDTVSRWNLGRQRFLASDVGHPKATVLVHRINLFYGVNYEAHPTMVSADRLGYSDLLITCTDSARFRAAIGVQNAKRATEAFWMDFGNGDATGQVVLGHLGKPKGARVPNVYDLFPQLATMDEGEAGPSCSMEEAVRRQPWPANRTVAIAGMTLLERWLRTGSLGFHGSLVQLDPYTVTPLTLDPVSWAMFGYAPKAKRPRKRAPRTGKAAATA